MGINSIITDPVGIIFVFSNSDTYMIEWRKIIMDGLSKCVDHLREKRWFTNEVSEKFMMMYYLHLCIN
ncbi:MAG: hypothetical protein HDS71_06225 [Bacteroidales bacterium]|nr:hypothetical protein [Bacteroidales bacterium]